MIPLPPRPYTNKISISSLVHQHKDVFPRFRPAPKVHYTVTTSPRKNELPSEKLLRTFPVLDDVLDVQLQDVALPRSD